MASPPAVVRRRLAIAALAGLIALPAVALGQGTRRDEGEKIAPEKQPTLTAPPQLIEGGVPDYPEEAAARGLEAEVPVRLFIDATGAVTRAEVITPVGHGFDEAAIAAAKRYRFKPAEWDGVPGPIVVETSIHFVLQESEPEPEPEPAEGAAGDDIEVGPPSHGGDMRKDVRIQGVALERSTRKKLSGVIVSLSGLGVDAITDEDGRFFFHGVPEGEYELIAAAEGHDRFERSLVLSEDEVLETKLYLRPVGGNPYETVVEGEREVIEVTRRTLERRQLTTVPGTFGDPIRVIQTLPGLARTPFVSGFLLIRGSNPDDSGTYIDGHRVPLLFHFLGGPSILNAEFLDKIDLYPGGFPAHYGRAIGGIVSVETRSAESDGIHGSADVDLLDAGGYVRVPVTDHGAFAVAGRRSYFDQFLGLVLPDPEPGETLIVVPVYYDYQLRFDYDFEEDGKASLFYIKSSDVLDIVSEDSEAEEFFNLNSSVNFSRLIGKYQRPISGGFRMTLSPAVGFDSVSFTGAQAEGEAAFTGLDIDVRTLSYRMSIDGDLGEHFYLDAGLDMDSRVTRYDLLLPIDDDVNIDGRADVDPESLVRNVDYLGYALYADLVVKLGDLNLIPGLRYDGNLLVGEYRHSLDPRLAARHQLTDEWLAKGYVGIFHQPPQPEALDPDFGNPNLDLEKAYHAGLGAEWAFAEDWMADAEVYLIERRDIVEFSNDVETDPDTGNLEPVNFRNSRIGDTIGLEFLLRREVTRNLFGWISYTLSRTRELEFNDTEYEPTAFDQRHTLNAVASYRIGEGWELGGRFRLATGRPATPVLGGTFDADDGDYRRLTGTFRSDRRKTFHQTDVRAEKTWLFDTWRIGVYLDIQNVFNVSNEEATQYDYRFRESAPVQGVPFLPTLGVRGQW